MSLSISLIGWRKQKIQTLLKKLSKGDMIFDNSYFIFIDTVSYRAGPHDLTRTDFVRMYSINTNEIIKLPIETLTKCLFDYKNKGAMITKSTPSSSNDKN